MKKLISIFLSVTVLVSCFAGCATQKSPESLPENSLESSVSEKEPESSASETVSENVSDKANGLPVLTYVAMGHWLPAPHTVEEINRYLLECGREYQVEFVSLPFDGYDAALAEYLSAGNPADLVFVSSLPEVREQLLDLTDYLDSEDGAELKSIYSEFGWGEVAMEGKIYTVPSNLYFDPPACYMVNRKLMEEMEFTEADLQKPLWELHDVLAKVREKNPQEDFFPLMVDDGRSILDTNQAHKPVTGFAVDRETREAAYIFDRPEIFELLRTLHQYTREGLVGIGSTGLEYSNECDEFLLLENAFLVYRSTGVGPYAYPYVYRSPDVYAEEDEDYLVITWQDPTIYCDRRADGTGVAADSQYQAEALDFLTLAMTDQTLTDFLQHGTEGEEYSLTAEGKVSPIEYEGPSAYSDYRCWLYGNRRIATPTIYEFADKRERAEQLLASGVISEFLDSPAPALTMEQQMAFYHLLQELCAVLDPDDSRSFDEIISEARAQMDEAGGREILGQWND